MIGHLVVPLCVGLVCLVPLLRRSWRDAFVYAWGLHAWAGWLTSLVFVVVLLCGIGALFREQLAIWLEPALPQQDGGVALAFDGLLAQLTHSVDVPRGATVVFKTTHASGWVHTTIGEEMWWVHATGAHRVTSVIANEIYELHFFGRLPYGKEVAGVFAIALLVITVSGVIIQLHRLGRELWQFRPRQRLRVAASDAHKALGVFGVPYVTLLAWSGSLLCLDATIARAVTFGRGPNILEYTPSIRHQASGQSWTTPSLDAAVFAARRATSAAGRVQYLTIRQFGDVAATVEVTFAEAGFGTPPYAVVEVASGEVVETTRVTAASALTQALFGLHFARYAGQTIKWIYALLAFAAAAVVVTGNLLWAERRDPQRRRASTRIIEGSSYALPPALIAAALLTLLGSRLLFANVDNRATLELVVFYASWAAATLAGSAWYFKARSRDIGPRTSDITD